MSWADDANQRELAQSSGSREREPDWKRPPVTTSPDTDDTLTKQLLGKARAAFATGDDIELNIKLSDLEHLIEQHLAEQDIDSRISELTRIDTRRHYGMDYQESLDALDVYKDDRLDELKKQRKDGHNG